MIAISIYLHYLLQRGSGATNVAVAENSQWRRKQSICSSAIATDAVAAGSVYVNQESNITQSVRGKNTNVLAVTNIHQRPRRNRRRSIILNALEKSISVIVAANTLPSQNESIIELPRTSVLLQSLREIPEAIKGGASQNMRRKKISV